MSRRTEYAGDILSMRAVEDCIRATRRYTKGAFTREKLRPTVQAIQGDSFPSRVITEYYEVYPEMDVSWDMPVSDFIEWAWGDTPHIDIRFFYNYSANKANMVIHGSNGVLKMLKDGIPGLEDALKIVVDSSHR
jgi:hypothetical protein